MDVKSRSKEDLVYELRALKEKNERLKARVQACMTVSLVSLYIIISPGGGLPTIEVPIWA